MGENAKELLMSLIITIRVLITLTTIFLVFKKGDGCHGGHGGYGARPDLFAGMNKLEIQRKTLEREPIEHWNLQNRLPNQFGPPPPPPPATFYGFPPKAPAYPENNFFR